jgi:hypothetical protein
MLLKNTNIKNVLSEHDEKILEPTEKNALTFKMKTSLVLLYALDFEKKRNKK